jgi:hypothetical protein
MVTTRFETGLAHWDSHMGQSTGLPAPPLLFPAATVRVWQVFLSQLSSALLWCQTPHHGLLRHQGGGLTSSLSALTHSLLGSPKRASASWAERPHLLRTCTVSWSAGEPLPALRGLWMESLHPLLLSGSLLRCRQVRMCQGTDDIAILQGYLGI